MTAWAVSAVGPSGKAALAMGIGEANAIRQLARVLRGELGVSEAWAPILKADSLPAEPHMPDLAFPTSLLDERTHVLEHAIAHYIANPEARSRIGSAAEFERLTGEGPARMDVKLSEEPRSSPKRAVPTASRVMLWFGGIPGVLLTLAGIVDGSERGREISHLLGVLVFGTTSVAALLAAWLLPRRPRTGRRFGLIAAAGAVFVGWLLTQSSGSGLVAVLIGIGTAATGAYVAWELFRWSPRASSFDSK